ncbi:TolC family protein [Citromicrobium bathyomarinum]|uniref:TolC family protein n=1 Tax=Citromicrobium bathyomarinum TaxID=72174 RepID=UPI00315A70DC
MRAVALLLTATLLVHPAAQLTAQDAEPAPRDDPAPVAYGPLDDPVARANAPPPVAIPDPLDRAARLAVDTHPQVRAAQAEAAALAADKRGADQLRLPRASIEALAATEGSSFADTDGLALNAVLEQPIWSGGRVDGEIQRAAANLRAGQDRLGEARNNIVLRVVQAYYDYVRAQARYDILDASLGQHRDLLAAIGRRVDQQVSPRADLTLGRSRTAQVELDRAIAGETRESAQVRLQVLSGLDDVRPVLPLESAVETLPPEAVALDEALACSPELAALTDLVDVARAQRSIARSDVWPEVVLQLSQNEITGTRAAVVLRAQFGAGLSQFRAVDAADARIQRAIAEFGEAERRLREQLRRDYVLVRATTARVEAGVLAVDTAAEIIESYKRQFIAGRRSWLDVMNATREAASAQLSEADARVVAAESTARILALTCRWQPGSSGALAR